VARSLKKDSVGSALPLGSGQVQANQCLASARHASNKHHGFLTCPTRDIDNLFDPSGRYRQILRAGVMARDGIDGMARVQRLRGLDDRGRRSVRRRCPGDRVECRTVRCCQAEFNGLSTVSALQFVGKTRSSAAAAVGVWRLAPWRREAARAVV
jgi:hypothetical protein